MNVFRHSGDLGDCIACLPVIRQLGGGYLILGNVGGQGAREMMSEARFNANAPLLAVQSYISGVRFEQDGVGMGPDGRGKLPASPTEEEEGAGFCFHRFREKPWLAPEYNLATWQANYFGIKDADLDLSPWLFAHPAEETKGRAVFARSGRYHNPAFPWRRIVQENPGALFVGLPEEWEAFKAETCLDELGARSPEHGEKPITYRPTVNLLEVAELIAGSELFVGNQSCAFWIAAGLGHRLVQETDPWNLNSVVKRENAEYWIR